MVNTYYPGTANAAAGATSLSLGTATGATTAVASGDLLLVVQMQGAVINYGNTYAYGDGTGTGSGATSTTAGQYEYVTATSAAGGTTTIKGTGTGGGLLHAYTNAAGSATQGQQTFQVIRVPQFRAATIATGLTASAWNGTTGGVLAIDVAGALDFAGKTVDVSSEGFRGGAGIQLSGVANALNTGLSATNGVTGDYVHTSYGNVTSTAVAGYHASKGEGSAGTPRFVYNGTATQIQTLAAGSATDGYPGGSFARGAPGNAGGGGTDSDPNANDDNTGGGGGGNGGAGGMGGNGYASNAAYGGFGGIYTPAFTKIVMGGGGGAGTRNNSAGVDSGGGVGGGMVFVRANTLNTANSGTLQSNGGVGVVPANDGGGGGGAGGSVSVSLFAANGSYTGLTVNAIGGAGQNANPNSTVAHGPGGGGGGGVVVYSPVGTAPASALTGGANGITDDTNGNSEAFGATSGSTGQLLTQTAVTIPGVSSGAECTVPGIALVKAVNATTAVPGDPLTYTITFTNSGPGTATTFAITDPIPGTTDFKIGSAATTLGTTGLTAAISYSNNSGSTYAYTPASGTGGAPAGYDRTVTNVRWLFTGTFSQTSPNNTGSVTFVARVR